MAVIQVEVYKEPQNIQKGVRQGCSLSTLLFNLYIEQAVKKVKEKYGKGVRIQGETYKMLRFADDIVILTESERDLECLMNGLDTVLNKLLWPPQSLLHIGI